LDEIFVEVISVVHKRWLNMKRDDPSVNLMQFNDALRRGFDANSDFWEHTCKDLGELKICGP